MRGALHIVALAAVAVAQPIYDLLSRNANFFVAHDSSPGDLLWLVAVLSIAVPATLLVMLGGVSLLSRSAARLMQRSVVALLCGLIGLQGLAALAWIPGEGALVPALLGLAIAAAAFHAYARLPVFRSFLGVLSLAALVFPARFLLSEPVRSLLFPERSAGSASAIIQSEAPVVVLVLDELPLTSLLDASQGIDAARYPNFARFAETSYWFRAATTVAERTTLALPALLTGRYPDGNRLATAEQYPENLFSLFAGSHRFSVFETHSRLCPEQSCSSELQGRRGDEPRAMLSDALLAGLQVVFPRAWTSALPTVTETWRDFGRESGTRDADGATDFRDLVRERRFDSPWLHERFLRSFAVGDAPTLFFLHLSLPHVPWRYLPSGNEYRPAPIFPEGLDPADRDLWGADPWPVTQAAQRHLLQVGYADRLVGEMLDALDEAGLYQSALVVIVSDHGVGLQPGERRRGLSPGNRAEILCVPLLIKLPGQRKGVVSDRNAETIDLLPSIADALGASLPWRVDGQSLFGPGSAARNKKLVFERLPDKQSYARLELDPAALARARTQRAASLQASFGTGAFDPAVFAIGPHPELIGSPISQLRVAGALAEVGVALDAPARRLATVDPLAVLQPVRITGTLRSDRVSPGGLQLALSLDGTLRATTRSSDEASGRARFAAMIPESALHAGRNELELFVIREDSQGVLLEPTWDAGAGED